MLHTTGNNHWKNVAGLSALAIVLSCAALGQTPTSAPDASAPGARIQTEELLPPLLMKGPALNYPTEEIRQSGEGWVQVDMMVDHSGKPFEVTVEASSGDKVFEKEAVRAVEGATYQPGMLNGQPIESAAKIKIVFILNEPSTGAREEFVHQYMKLEKAVAAKDRAAADGALKGLEVRNLYEDAYFGLATYLYGRQWGDEAQQLAGLRRAIAYEKKAHYLTTVQFQSALVQCLALEVKLKHFGEAQRLWTSLLLSGIDAATIAKIKPTMQQLDHIRTADGAYDVSGSMPDGTWGLELYKRNFRFKVSEGHISYVKLRCSKGFVRFVFDPNIDYKVDPQYGVCWLGLDGGPGTQFILTQF
jgi:TonB family protein